MTSILDLTTYCTPGLVLSCENVCIYNLEKTIEKLSILVLWREMNPASILGSSFTSHVTCLLGMHLASDNIKVQIVLFFLT